MGIRGRAKILAELREGAVLQGLHGGHGFLEGAGSLFEAEVADDS